jgi:4-hydroxybenzoate polyprenyltransferase
LTFLKSVVSLILRTHLVVTLAATSLTYQSLLLTGDSNFRNHILLLIFSGTIFVYNFAHVIINIPTARKTSVKTSIFFNTPNILHIIICVVSFIAFLIGFNKATIQERFIITITGLCTIAYEMPFAKNDKRLHGIRNLTFFKNILLALVWAVATAWLPLISKTGMIHPLDIIFIFLKRFFFVLPLAMVFDVRDHFHDLKHNVKTISNQYGVQAVKNLAILSMVFFVIIVYLHQKSMEALGSQLFDFSMPLYISAIVTAVFIWMINPEKKNAYYIFIIDGSMILQFMLVYFFYCWR